MMRAVIFGLMLLAFCGCTTMKDTNVRSKNEEVRIEYAAPTNNIAFVVPSWAGDAAKQAGAWVLKEVSKKYTATWEGYRLVPLIDTNGAVIPTKITVKRLIDHSTVEAITFKFTPIASTSGKNYFTVEEDTLWIDKTKAKMTKFLSTFVSVDEIAMNVKLDMWAPNAMVQGGINTNTWELNYTGVVPGWTNNTHRISIWEVPTRESHIGIHITVLEENKIAGWLMQGSAALK